LKLFQFLPFNNLESRNFTKNIILEEKKPWARTVKVKKTPKETNVSDVKDAQQNTESKKEASTLKEKAQGRTFSRPMGKSVSKATGAKKDGKFAKKTFSMATTTSDGAKIILREFVIDKPAELMKFLIENLPSKSRDNIKSLLKNRLVSINGIAQTQFNLVLEPGSKLTIGKKTPRADMVTLSFKIAFEDDDVIVIEKPAGLLTMGSDKERVRTAYSQLSTYLKSQDEENKIFIVHRLDRDTSGLLVFAKNEEAKYNLQENWNEAILKRTYVALVEGKMIKKNDRIVSYLKESKALKVHSSKNPTYGNEAITNYKVIEERNNSTLVELNLETGRKNQIRVHMQEIGHPIVGDKKYGARTNTIDRLALHAKVLSFTHPITGEALHFESPTPRVFFL
jgi:23S rRNA pseudouridine1911/1915/1917 synthase